MLVLVHVVDSVVWGVLQLCVSRGAQLSLSFVPQ